MICGLLLSSCLQEKEDQQLAQLNPEIEAAKSWYEGFEIQNQSSENARKVKNGRGKPDWGRSKVYNQADGKKVIEVGFDFDEIAIPEHLKTEKLAKNSVLQTLLLFPNQHGDYTPYFLNIYPEDPDFKFELADFQKGGYQVIPDDFSGSYRFYRWNGKFIGGWRIKDGIKTYRIKNSKNNLLKNSSRISSGTLYCYQVITTWYTYTCSEEGGCSIPQEVGTTVDGIECEYVLAPPSPKDPDRGGGGSEPPSGEDCEQPEGNLLDVPVDCEEEEEEEELYTIENNVKDICIRGPVQEAITQDFKTQISDIILNVFGESENISVYIDDVDYLPDSVDGSTFSGVSGGYPNFIIELNRNILKNSSKEYITITVFHEFLHAYITYLNNMDITEQSADHQQMVDDYIVMLFQTLQNIYGIGSSDAIRLAWGGLYDTQAWKDKSISFKNNVISTNQEYRIGDKGTKCGPLF